MLKKDCLLIFIKNPTVGKVKTRLAATLGDDKALEVYKALTAYTQSITADVNVNRQVWYSSFIDNSDGWSSHHFEKKLQKGRDLGERMSKAFEHAFDEGCHKIVIIGSDCPGLTSHHLEKAFLLLEEKDCVMGPSEDGGYYLLGLRKKLPALFKDRKWSTESVLKEAIATLKTHGFSYELLEELNDIDNEEDLKKSNFKPEIFD